MDERSLVWRATLASLVLWCLLARAASPVTALRQSGGHGRITAMDVGIGRDEK